MWEGLENLFSHNESNQELNSALKDLTKEIRTNNNSTHQLNSTIQHINGNGGVAYFA